VTDTLETDENIRVIASTKVEGTRVYDKAGEKLGSISTVMIEKRSGKATYAVLEFGGLFGLGSDHYPIPWDMLTYRETQGGYVVDIDKSQLEGAPRYQADVVPAYDDDYGRGVYGYWGVPYPYV
jgi:sporulation protein YlmC with PRC-barrel domain